jgi:Xaa-Pro aminopeptidase
MRKLGLDVVVAVKNAHYLSDTSAASAVIVAGRKSILLCSRMELDRARQQSSIKDIRAYSPDRVPLRKGEHVSFGKLDQVVARCFEELGAREIGFDRIKPETIKKLRGAYEASYHEIPELVWDLREIKTKKEIGWLRRSAKIAQRGMKRAEEFIEDGRSELEIAAEVEYEMRKSGSEGASFNTIVASGKNSWLPHAGATGKRLRRGELVIVDLGATYRGYASDMTRTFALGPTRKQKNLVRVAKRAQRVALRRIKDGVEAAKIDEAARMIFRRAGYERFCLHGSGHGVGLDIHEPPSLSMESEDILRRGMVVTVEPGVYVRGVGGARFEDMVVVTMDGRGPLTSV